MAGHQAAGDMGRSRAAGGGKIGLKRPPYWPGDEVPRSRRRKATKPIHELARAMVWLAGVVATWGFLISAGDELAQRAHRRPMVWAIISASNSPAALSNRTPVAVPSS